MTLTEKKEKLRNELNKLKSDGLRVFISKSDYYAYGLMTDGKNIIYVQYSTYGEGFKTIFEYIPSRKNGSGCATLKECYEHKELSMEIFYESVQCGKILADNYKAERYKDIEQFFRINHNIDMYVEL